MNHSKQVIEVSDQQLRLGMYVMLPRGWLDHPFLLNNFLIKNQDQLKKLKLCKLGRIKIDLSRSTLPSGWNKPKVKTAPAEQPVKDPKETGELPNWNPETLVPDELNEALHDHKMPAELRSQAVYSHSRELMNRLLESPTAENLKASKKVIGSITDVILSDDATAHNMVRITDHDFYTYTHSVNVGVLSIMLAKAMFGQSDAHDMHELGAGFFLHDLGKVNIRPEVINKPGKLDEAEMRHMRTHPYKGYKLLENSGQLSEECRIIILQHHERSDASGYPKQLDNDQIHVYGKICCIADVFDALTAERSYKKELSRFDALKLMKAEMSDHFDKELFSKFVHLLAAP